MPRRIDLHTSRSPCRGCGNIGCGFQTLLGGHDRYIADICTPQHGEAEASSARGGLRVSEGRLCGAEDQRGPAVSLGGQCGDACADLQCAQLLSDAGCYCQGPSCDEGCLRAACVPIASSEAEPCKRLGSHGRLTSLDVLSCQQAGNKVGAGLFGVEPHLDGVAERRSGAVHLQRGHLGGRHPSIRQGQPNDLSAMLRLLSTLSQRNQGSH